MIEIAIINVCTFSCALSWSCSFTGSAGYWAIWPLSPFAKYWFYTFFFCMARTVGCLLLLNVANRLQMQTAAYCLQLFSCWFSHETECSHCECNTFSKLRLFNLQPFFEILTWTIYFLFWTIESVSVTDSPSQTPGGQYKNLFLVWSKQVFAFENEWIAYSIWSPLVILHDVKLKNNFR